MTTGVSAARRSLENGWKIVGVALFVISIGLMVYMAWAASNESPPSGSQAALLTLLSAAAQAIGAWVFSRLGRPDPALAERTVARLVRLAARASEADCLAQSAFERKVTAAEGRVTLGQLSVSLSYLEEGLLDSIEDWRTFQARAVDRASESTMKIEKGRDDE